MTKKLTVVLNGFVIPVQWTKVPWHSLKISYQKSKQKKIHVRLINYINPWQPSILMQVDFIACFTMKITETWNGLKFLYSNHSHFLLLTCPHSFVLLKKWIKCVKYVLRHFFVSFPFPTLSLKLCLVSISAFHLQSTHKRMWAGLQKKVRLVAVQKLWAQYMVWWFLYH